MKKCIGFGNFERKCENEVDKKINPNWCERCNKIRIEHVNKCFDNIMKQLGE